MVVLGTRPEAVKLAPVIHGLRRHKALDTVVCATAQHREMLDSVLEIFNITPDFDLDLMQPNQSLPDLTSRALLGITQVLASEQPDMVICQGDTTTTFVASLAAYYQRIAVGHVEAGLRTNDKFQPFPEEINRRLTTQVADLHFAPTEEARQNLLRSDVRQAQIFVTGNTVIDALLSLLCKQSEPEQQAKWRTYFQALGIEFRAGMRQLLVTGHRRENFGEGIRSICEALRTLAERRADLQIIYPVHLNPNIKGPVYELIGHCRNIHLIEPQSYEPFLYLMSRADIVLTDSGGIQEEAPSLHKPVLVMRNTTERPEGVAAGLVKLVGTNAAVIVAEVLALLDGKATWYNARAANPYGDGKASERIAAAILAHFGIPAAQAAEAALAPK